MKTFQLARFGEAGDEIISQQKIDWNNRKPSLNTDGNMITSNNNTSRKRNLKNTVESASLNNSNSLKTRLQI
jgi:hypothetical protein